MNFSDFYLLSIMSDFRTDKLMNVVEDKLKTQQLCSWKFMFFLECTIGSRVFTWCKLLLL